MRSVAVRVAFSMCTYSFLGSTLATLGVRSLQSSLRACGPHHSQLAGAFWQYKAGCQLHDCIARHADNTQNLRGWSGHCADSCQGICSLSGLCKAGCMQCYSVWPGVVIGAAAAGDQAAAGAADPDICRPLPDCCS